MDPLDARKEPRLDWTNPICERDWIAQESRPVGGNDYVDRMTERVDDESYTAIRVPVRLIGEALKAETCGWCGEPTIFGVYKRVDPTTIPFHREKSRALAATGSSNPDRLDAPWWGVRAIEAARRLFSTYPNADSDGLMEFRVALREYDAALDQRQPPDQPPSKGSVKP